MQAVYPVLFTKTEDCILVEVPDLEVLTEGKDMKNAIDMARDAMELTCVTLEDHKKEYRRKIDTKTVRRNVALPSWLNYEAEHAGINVSRVLQEALMNVLNVKRNL